jgi:hypothetical protein
MVVEAPVRTRARFVRVAGSRSGDAVRWAHVPAEREPAVRTLGRAAADRISGVAVALLAALALADVTNLATMQHAAVLVAAIGVAGLAAILRAR